MPFYMFNFVICKVMVNYNQPNMIIGLPYDAFQGGNNLRGPHSTSQVQPRGPGTIGPRNFNTILKRK